VAYEIVVIRKEDFGAMNATDASIQRSDKRASNGFIDADVDMILWFLQCAGVFLPRFQADMEMSCC
jgi:hypothetical protein